MNRFSRLISEIVRGAWAISPKDAAVWAPQVDNWLTGKIVLENDQRLPAFTFDICAESGSEKASSFDNAPKNSIAVIPLEGPMTLKGGFCSYGTDEIAQAIAEAAAHENISGIILSIDSGGGTTDSIVPLVEAIQQVKALGKPIISLANYALSAAYRVAAETDMIIASNNMAEFGSIGVFAKFQDSKEYNLKQGIKMITVYAPESSDKNKPFEEALNGNFELLQSEFLSPIAKDFQENVRKARAGKLDESTPGILSGRTFFAKADGFDSIANGLIDKIGNLQFAIDTINGMTSRTSINKVNNHNQNFSHMNTKQIPLLLAILGFQSLEMTEGKAHLSKSDVGKIQDEFLKNSGKSLQLTGATIADDGSAQISEMGLYTINADLVNAKIEANTKKAESELNYAEALRREYEAKLEEKDAALLRLAGETDDKITSRAPKGGMKVIFAGGTGLNVADALHPWNEAALAIANGNKSYAHYVLANGITKDAVAALQNELVAHGASTLNINQMNTVLGAKYLENVQEIADMMVTFEEVSSLFPWRSTGIKDELPNLALFVSEFLQPRNSSWAEKGGFEIQADVVKVKNWQVSHRFTAAQMWQFIESWLATKTQGTDPFQESLVQWLTNKMMAQIALVERPYNAIRGVYVTPVAGVAGKSINSQDGVMKAIQRLINDYRILVYNVGKGTYEFVDGSGNINKNHVYYKIVDMIKRMPQQVRDGFNWVVQVSKNDLRERNRFQKEVISVNSNYAEVEKAESYDNFTYKGVPYFPDGLIVITLANNILQGYREKADDNRIYFDKEKRDTIVFMDGGYVIAPVQSGKKFDTLAELAATNGEFQRVFTNGEFGAYTPIDIAAGDTTPSVAVHNVLKTVANAGATVITTIDDAKVGDTIYIIGGSDTNSSTIAANNTNFIGLAAAITFSVGVMAKFQCTATGKFTLVGLYQEENLGAMELAVDDATPDLKGSTLVVTNSRHTAAVAITDFPDAVIGTPFKVLGGGGTNATTIAAAGKFAYIPAAWTGTSGASIVLVLRPDGQFVVTLY
jgi:protease IV